MATEGFGGIDKSAFEAALGVGKLVKEMHQSSQIAEAFRVQREIARLAQDLQFGSQISSALKVRLEVENLAGISKSLQEFKRIGEGLEPFSAIGEQLRGIQAVATSPLVEIMHQNAEAARLAFEPMNTLAREMAALQNSLLEPIWRAQEPVAAIVREFASQQAAMQEVFGGLSVVQLEALNASLLYAFEEAHEEFGDTDEIALVDFDGDFEARRQKLISRLVTGFIVFFGNSQREYSQIGIFWLINFILAIAPYFQSPDFTPEDRQRLEVIAAQVGQMAEQLEQAHAQAGESIGNLPRGIIMGKGRLRQAPSAKAELLLMLPEGTEVAIVGREGRWFNIIYRSNLTQELEAAWVYRSSLHVVQNVAQ